jgi:hypothetical protein
MAESGRPRAVPPWARYGAVAGAVAFALTLSANLLVLALSLSQLCRVGPAILPLSSLAGFLGFLLLAAVAGFATGRATGQTGQAALSGLLVGVLSGCALLAFLAFTPAIHQRMLEASGHCPAPNPFQAGIYVFRLGATPPPGLIPSPPPGAFAGSPPPGFFTTSSGGSVALSFSGTMERVLEVISLGLTIAAGMGFAAGSAALGGLVGAGVRRR